jgi:hypothetical protein
MKKYRVTISNPDNQAMAELVSKHHIPVFDHGIQGDRKTGFKVDAFLDENDIKKLEIAGYKIQRHEDIAEVAKARRKEIGLGDRYKQKGPR